jgi:broad specificity phosphatase PhoE
LTLSAYLWKNTPMKKLYFVRHGESHDNVKGVWSGLSDVALTRLGKVQAKAVGQELKKRGTPIDIILSSPLPRAHHTARIIADQINYPAHHVKLHESLSERNFGTMEGVAHGHLQKREQKLAQLALAENHESEAELYKEQ